MTLPSSGAISISQAAAEFGVALPCVFPDAFYGKPGMPSSGPLILPDDFYGKSNVTFSHPSGAYNDVRLEETATITVTCSIAAVWTWTRTGSGAGTSASIASGGSGTTFTVIQAAPITPGIRSTTYTVTATAGGITRNYTLKVESERSD